MTALIDRRQFLKTAGTATAAAAMAAGVAGAVKEDRQPMKVLLWCWDARMGWDDEPGTVTQRMAAPEKKFPYPKRSEAFASGCRRLVDYCARVGVHGVILWGFLRDCHGGVKAAADLCKYASDCGVAILPGVGLCSYGGYYYGLFRHVVGVFH